MPRRDTHHEAVRRALEKEGWRITHDPLTVRHRGLRVFIDLAAEQVQPASIERVAIEIKVFGGSSKADDFERAVGQYELYRTILQDAQISRDLYLAISQTAWKEISKVDAFRFHLRVRQIHVLVFDPDTEEVKAWIRQPNLTVIEPR